MLRRHFTGWFCVSLATLAGAAENRVASLRGKLTAGTKPVIATSQGETVLAGDAGTMKVLADARLSGLDLEVLGEPSAPGVFRVGPLHERALFVHQHGKRLLVTYWCAVCSIRTFTPGVCMCCQDETAVDLIEKLDSDDLRGK